MSRPLLQLALDHTSLQAAQRDVRDAFRSRRHRRSRHHSMPDRRAKRCSPCAQCPDKIIVADWKVADAGKRWLSRRLAQAQTEMTIICAAPLATVERGHEVALRGGGEIQMELFGNWTLDDARAWHRIGVKQAIYHLRRDAQAGGSSGVGRISAK